MVLLFGLLNTTAHILRLIKIFLIGARLFKQKCSVILRLFYWPHLRVVEVAREYWQQPFNRCLILAVLLKQAYLFLALTIILTLKNSI